MLNPKISYLANTKNIERPQDTANRRRPLRPARRRLHRRWQLQVPPANSKILKSSSSTATSARLPRPPPLHPLRKDH